ncbi:MAG: hypothetical protein ABIY48_11085 [Acidimicrobiales bacterium]
MLVMLGAGAVIAASACGGGSKGSVAELCAAVRADRSTATVFAGFDPSDTERALTQLRAARVTLGELRDAAPSEVRDELSVEIAYVQAMIDGLKGLAAPDAAQSVEVVRQATADHPKVADAAAALAAFSKQHCTRS